MITFARFATFLIALAQAEIGSEVAHWIEKLGSDGLEEREIATEKLKRLGPVAVPFLKKATEGNDREVSQRCLQILDHISSEVAKSSFKKIEDTLKSAKTITVNFSGETRSLVSGREVKYCYSGLLLLKDENKANISGEQHTPNSKSEFWLISDGTQYITDPANGSRGQKRIIPPRFGSNLRSLLLNVGALSTFAYSEDGSGERSAPKNAFEPIDFKEVPQQGKKGEISYKLLGAEGLVQEIRIVLCYERDSFRLLSRTTNIKLRDGSGESSSAEKYETYSLDAEIADEKFNISQK